MSKSTQTLLRAALAVALCLAATPLVAQPQVRFNQPIGQIQPVQATSPAPPAVLGSPVQYDPYGGGYVPAQTAPSLPPGYPQTQVAPATPTPVYGPQPYGAPTQPAPLGGPAYPSGSPASVFPNGFGTTYGQPGVPGWQQAQPYLRLFNRFQFQYTWMDDNGDRGMGIQDLDINITAAFPNFLWSGDPLYVTPGFTMHLWEGPQGDLPAMQALGVDVPSKAYSAYLGFGWQPRLPSYRQFGADLSVITGVYSDFNAINSDSLRIQGTALLVLQLTPTLQLKGGIVYLDRRHIKLLPAGGVVWTPNDRTEFNILFPNPKLRKYWTTLGQTDVWWYISGEYGGGSWTVEQLDGTDTPMDINDIRIGGGLDFVAPGGRVMWVEAAYVFERELYFSNPPMGGSTGTVDLSDSIMLRAGISF